MQVNQRVLSKQLKNMGMEVHVANHGGEAIERLMQSTYWREGQDQEGRIELNVVLMVSGKSYALRIIADPMSK